MGRGRGGRSSANAQFTGLGDDSRGSRRELPGAAMSGQTKANSHRSPVSRLVGTGTSGPDESAVGATRPGTRPTGRAVGDRLMRCSNPWKGFQVAGPPIRPRARSSTANHDRKPLRPSQARRARASPSATKAPTMRAIGRPDDGCVMNGPNLSLIMTAFVQERFASVKVTSRSLVWQGVSPSNRRACDPAQLRR